MKKFIRSTTDKWGFLKGQLFEITEEVDGYVRVRVPGTNHTSVLFHPDASLFECVELIEVTPTPVERPTICPCGIHRADCDYHR